MPAGDGKTISINIRAITGELTSGLRTATSATRQWATETQGSIAQVEASTERISRLWRSAFEAFLGFEAVKALRELALGASEAANKLDVAAVTAKNFGHSLDPKAMETWIEGFANSAKGGGYAIDEMRNAAQLFAAIGLDTSQIQRAMADTAQLAASRNLDFAQATNIVRMALTGHVEMLTRYGVISREAAKNIHNVEQAMEALEKASRGAAEERAQKLIGAFGRLGNAFTLFGESIGTALIPFFTKLSNVLTNLANILDKIPAPVLKVVSTVAALAISLGATALVLPAIAKGFAILGEGLKLAGAVSGITRILTVARTATLALVDANYAAAASFVAEAAIPALIAAGIAALSIVIIELAVHWKDTAKLFGDLAQYMRDKWAAFVANFMATFAPIIDFFAKVFSAVASAWNSFVGFLDGLWTKFVNAFQEKTQAAMSVLARFTSSLQPVANSWDQFCDYLDKRFGAFVDHLGERVKQAITILEGLATGGAIAGPIGAAIGLINATGNDKKTRADQARVGSDAGRLLADFKSDLKGLLSGIKGLLNAPLGKSPKIPGEAFTGEIPGKTRKGKDTAPAAAENALKNFDEATKNWLAKFQGLVDQAKAHVDISAEKLADFDVKHPANVPMSDALIAQRQSLVNNQLKAEQELRTRLLQQQQAENTAASEYRKIAESISTHLKNHDQLVRQALDGARSHAKAAQDIYLNYLRVGTELDSIIAKERERRNQAADNAVQLADDRAQLALDSANIARETQGAQLGRQVGIDKAAGRGSPKLTLAEDQLAIEMAELAKETAVATEAMKQTAVAEARKAYDVTGSIEDSNKLTAAMNALNEATLGVIKADNTLAETQAKFMADQHAQWNQLIDSLIQKAQVPGLSGSSAAGFSFNPLGLLFDALEKTQMFGDVMNTVTQIVNTFAMALNAFRPVVDAVLQVVRAVANVFIFLYNSVARILDLFGLQIQQLQYLTDAMSGLIPLITIWHEIPTLNELAAGKLNSPLSNVPTGLNNIGQTNGGQNMLMRVVEILTGILMATIVEKVLTGMSLQHAVQSTLQLIGIKFGQTHQTAQAAALSSQERAQAQAIAAKAQGLQQAIGAKAASGVQVTNTLLQQILLTLHQMLVSLQTQSTGGFRGLLGGLLGSGGGASVLGALGSVASVLGPMGAAAQGVSNAFNNVTNALQNHSNVLRQNAAALMQFGEAVSNASRGLAFAGAGGGSSTSLALDFSRRAAGSRYRVDGLANY